MYSDSQIERLRLLRLAVQAGRSIGEVAALPETDLRDLVASDRDAARETEPVVGPTRPGDPVPVATHLASCLAAVEALDAERLRHALEGAVLELGAGAVVDGVLVPLMQRVGERWHAGTLRIRHEHLATHLVRSALASLRPARMIAPGAPALLVAALAGQRHELGAMAAAALAELDGWSATFLGGDLPAEEIADAAATRGVKVVAVSLVYPPGDPGVGEELRRLGDLLPRSVAILAGGEAAESYDDELRAIGARRVADLAGFRLELRRIAEGPRSI